MNSTMKTYVHYLLLVGLSYLLATVTCVAAPDNTAVGAGALNSTTTGAYNTAAGYDALQNNTIGSGNTAVGNEALHDNTQTSFNTAVGVSALRGNNGGQNNTAEGWSSLLKNVTGSDNTASGYQALELNTSGKQNTAAGVDALEHNNGDFNTASGYQALGNKGVGNKNTAVGFQALVGLKKGDFNIGLGNDAGGGLITGNNNIYIGSGAGAQGESGSTRIGTKTINVSTYIAGIRGITTGQGNAIPVVIDAAGQLGTANSSERFKKDIKPMDRTSDIVLALKPVTFHYKGDETNTPQFGLIAEEVEKVNPDLIVQDDNGRPLSVRYDAVNAMLLNEFLKEHQEVQQLKAMLAAVNKRLAEQDAKMDKVNANTELMKSTPQFATNK
jgi:hypothetical protein